jgi:type I restriction enzyme M protein
MNYKNNGLFINLKDKFVELRDYLAGNATGITRDETLAEQLIYIMFCKIFDEKHNLGFFNNNSNNSKPDSFLFNDFFSKVKSTYKDLFDEKDKIILDQKSLSYLINSLSDVSIINSPRDAIGDAFEVFIGTAFRGGEGQFFTPKNIVQMIVDILRPGLNDKVIDPACGSGGFLTVTALNIMQNNKNKNLEIYGIDKDNFLAKITRAYLTILSDQDAKVYSENSLDDPENWSKKTSDNVIFEKFDFVITNPPFGSKIPIRDVDILKQYDLARKWVEKDGTLEVSDKMLDHQPPQILFIERCEKLLKKGGKLAIVLPDGILGNTSEKYIRQYILNNFKIIAIIDAPSETFQPSTSTKTSVLILEKGKFEQENYKVFMSMVQKCGHDKRGKAIEIDEFTLVKKHFFSNQKEYNRLGYFVEIERLTETEDLIFSPKYYDPKVISKIEELKNNDNYDLIKIKELVNDGTITIKRGFEVGSKKYGTGKIPFIRTSDISNWEIRVNQETSVSEKVYSEDYLKCDIKINDVLFVNDGGRMIGETALVTEDFEKSLFQSHIKRIRFNKTNKIDQYYFMFILKSSFLKMQIESKKFIQATIPSIGNRLLEIFIPVPKDFLEMKRISSKIESSIKNRSSINKDINEFINKNLKL